MASDHDFSVNTCCNPDRYGDVWLDSDGLHISPSPHGCNVLINTTEDAHKLIAAAQAFLDRPDIPMRYAGFDGTYETCDRVSAEQADHMHTRVGKCLR